MCSVDDDYINVGVYEFFNPLVCAGVGSNCCGNCQVARGNLSVWEMSRSVIKPDRREFLTSGSFSILFFTIISRASSGEIGSLAVMRVVVITFSTFSSKLFVERMSLVVRIPISEPCSSITGRP